MQSDLHPNYLETPIHKQPMADWCRFVISQNDTATASFAFFECQQGRSSSSFEHVVDALAR